MGKSGDLGGTFVYRFTNFLEGEVEMLAVKMTKNSKVFVCGEPN